MKEETDSVRLTKASKYLNNCIWKASKLYKLNNAEIVGIIQAISITLVQIMYFKQSKEIRGA